MYGDELDLDGKLPPVVQYLDALSQLVVMHDSGLDALNRVALEIKKLDQKLDQVVPDIFEKNRSSK
jgi:hypothetical protein